MASAAEVRQLAERRFDGVRIPVIYMDGVVYAGETMVTLGRARAFCAEVSELPRAGAGNQSPRPVRNCSMCFRSSRTWGIRHMLLTAVCSPNTMRSRLRLSRRAIVYHGHIDTGDSLHQAIEDGLPEPTTIPRLPCPTQDHVGNPIFLDEGGDGTDEIGTFEGE